MKLQTVLNKFTNDTFLITISGLCDEMRFSEYEELKKMDCWKDYKNCEVKSFAILLTNYNPELMIEI